MKLTPKETEGLSKAIKAIRDAYIALKDILPAGGSLEALNDDSVVPCQKKEELSKLRADVGRKGAMIRWQNNGKNGKRIAKHSNGAINKPDRKQPARNSDTHILIDYFIDQVRSIKGQKPQVNWGAAGAAAKKALKTRPLADNMQIMDWYLRQQKSNEHLTFNAVFTDHTVNKFQLEHKTDGDWHSKW